MSKATSTKQQQQQQRKSASAQRKDRDNEHASKQAVSFEHWINYTVYPPQEDLTALDEACSLLNGNEEEQTNEEAKHGIRSLR
jgi:hypothetical protein